MPYWTTDIGGYWGHSVDWTTSANNELFTRWFQYGAFNPIMRVHGTDIEREPYVFKGLDPEVYKSLLDAVHLRYRLLPYTYGLSAKVSSEHYTLMRALPMDFAGDTVAVIDPLTGDTIATVGATVSATTTFTLTAALCAFAPDWFRATAVSVCDPLPAVDESQLASYGAAVSSAPSAAPSRKN